MEWKSDIEIAQSTPMAPITKIAADLGVDEKYIEQYGPYKAKISLDYLRACDKPNGKLILVTAITPTPAGEGKTTTTVGLADGLKRIGKNVVVALREPSLGPVFGIKGGAAGGGLHRRLPCHRRCQQPASRHAGQPHPAGERLGHRSPQHHLEAYGGHE